MSIFSVAQLFPYLATDLSGGGGGTATLDREPDVVPEPAVDAVEEAPALTFADLGLSGALLESISAVGYEAPTPIQERVIPVLLDGHDAIAQAQTGSGKTAAFGFPIIERIDPEVRGVQALILCPTRELAIQVSEALHKYGRHKRVDTLPIYGGQPYERQFRGLQRGVQIVVGTPGRVMDHMRRGTLSLGSLSFFVLDEADEMLDMGFVDDIEWILQQVPAERQTALFSATIPPRISDLAKRYMRDPQQIFVRGRQMTVPETHQTYYEAPRPRKVDALTRILDAETPSSAMIFCRTKNGVDELGEALMARGHAVETLHGDLSQAQRDRVMRRFRSGQADTLIATDVAARGLDIPDVSHVINFDVPESAEAYVHRIGRTGRAGRGGEAVTLVTPRETRWLRSIERITRAKIEFRRLPTASDVNERRREVLKNLLRDQLRDEEAYSAYLEPVRELAEEEFDSVDIAAALLKLYAEETGRGTTVEQRDDDISTFSAAPPARGGRTGEAGMTRLFINIGRNFNVRPQDIVGAIANEANIPGRGIGAIDILDTTTFVDVPSVFVERVVTAMNAASIKGRPVNVEVAAEGAGRSERRGRPGGDFRRGPFRRDNRGSGGPRRDEEGRGRRFGGPGGNGSRPDRGGGGAPRDRD
ncbi:MAG: DEAD/DEAH box helicase [Chloroflexia bacterium]|nr:DEAD/DEAH box helicase [Chloroflexia bacterium]